MEDIERKQDLSLLPESCAKRFCPECGKCRSKGIGEAAQGVSAVTAAAGHSRMQASTFPAAASGKGTLRFWDALPTSGSMDRACLAGRRVEGMSGTRTGSRPPSGSTIVQKHPRIIQR